MSDLISKLNVLLRATVNSSLSGSGPRGSVERGDREDRQSAPKLTDQQVDSQIRTLRQHIDAALDAEDAMRVKLDDQNAQINALDQQVDAALLDGDNANARVLAQRLQRQRQNAVFLQSDLENHRRSTSDLIEQVNQLEAQISEARANVTSDRANLTPPADLLQAEPPPVSQAVRVPITVNRPANAPSTSNDSEIDDDLARRRARLTGPDSPKP